jgi:riboflavin kinase/FMN adenylyltransferase
MIFQARHIKGHARGRRIGFPTINLTIPDDLVLDDGIYAVWVTIGPSVYKGALHYGPTPTFQQKEKTMEVYLLDITDDTFPDTNNVAIEINVIERLRTIMSFDRVDDLTHQIALDVKKVRSVLG